MSAITVPQNLSVDRQRQDKKLLRIFNYYRLTLSLILLFTYFNEIGKDFIGLEYPLLFIATTLFYTTINLGLALLLLRDHILRPAQISGNILIDIAVLSLLTYANGGVGSGFGILIILSIAAGSILIRGHHTMMFAAAASLAMLSIEIYRALIDNALPHYFQAGVLGMVFFATSLFTKGVSRRIDTSENLATQQATDIAHLEELNRLIIQRMRTGIVVCNQEGQIRMMNQAAVILLSDKEAILSPTQRNFGTLPEPLQQRFNDWQHNPRRRPSPFQVSPKNPEIQANFAPLLDGDKSEVLVFLEDNSKAIQRAQQLKLASLGQLTASIAHEIRNPLGAISHAAQLLDESESLIDADRRLAHIVQDHSKRVNNTIENILELSRRRPSSPDNIRLKPWLEEFTLAFNEAEQNTGIFTLEVMPDDLEVQFDPSQLNQVVTNLSKNGLRYSEKQTGTATLHLRAGVRRSSELPFLDIIDEGPGVDGEALPHLFEPFYTTERSGTGLGLYISRELCQANNARLDYITGRSGGSCFRITFPHPKQIAA